MVANTVTLLNRLPRNFSGTNKDEWFKHTLYNIPYKKEQITSVNGTTVSLGEIYTVLLPFNELYLPYFDWRNLDDKSTRYTVNQGDLIFLREVKEDINADSVVKLKTAYKPYVCEVKSFEEVERKYSIKYQIKVSGV